VKQQIIFFWTELDYTFLDSIYELCAENGYIPKWQKGFGWSIGVFENEIGKDEVLISFLECLEAPIIKQSKSSNSVQAKKYALSSKIIELKLLYKEIQKENKRKNKKMANILLEDCYLNIDEINEIEKIYKYRLSENEINKINQDVEKYINAFPTLKNFISE